METPLDQQKNPDASASQSTSNELIQLICKLRWIGMEEEAERLLGELAQRPRADADGVFAMSGETD
ncbi:MAG: hypothetical protein ABSE22_13270 [Xanthobacteraceae bacterium]|jgi:hypothetical protein